MKDAIIKKTIMIATLVAATASALDVLGAVRNESTVTEVGVVSISAEGGTGEAGRSWYVRTGAGYRERHDLYVEGEVPPAWVTGVVVTVGYPTANGGQKAQDYRSPFGLDGRRWLASADGAVGGSVGFAVSVYADENTNKTARSYGCSVIDVMTRYYNGYETKATTICAFTFSQRKGSTAVLPKAEIDGPSKIAADGTAAFACRLTGTKDGQKVGTPEWGIEYGAEFAAIDESSGRLTAKNKTFTEQKVRVVVAVEVDGEAVVASKTVKIEAARIPAGMFNADKSRSMSGVMYSGGRVSGAVTLKTTKKNKKGVFKVSGKVVTLDGKSHSMKSASVDLNKAVVNDELAIIVAGIEVKGLGRLDVALSENSYYGAFQSGDEIESRKVGGNLKRGRFRLDRDFSIPAKGVLQKDLIPYEFWFDVAGGKWKFAKAANVKVAKSKTTGLYELTVNTDKGKTNISGLKLTYKSQTGMFKGTFKAFSVETASNGKAKLVKHTVNIVGLVVDGVGYGTAWCKKPATKSYGVEVE